MKLTDAEIDRRLQRREAALIAEHATLPFNASQEEIDEILDGLAVCAGDNTR